jgi:hypothetical protein
VQAPLLGGDGDKNCLTSIHHKEAATAREEGRAGRHRRVRREKEMPRDKLKRIKQAEKTLI